MPKAISSLWSRLQTTVSGFSVAQRTIAIIGIAILVMGGIALGSWLAKPQMSPLFTGLSAADASAVVEQLQSASVEYELTDGGSSILVPEKDVYSQRLAAASAGLPGESSNGYALLDDMGVTSSEFQQSVTYKRAIEGELAQTIGAMSGITSASVQLAIPEDSVFVSEKQDPTASVFVRTQGTALGDDQVEAIAHLTSAAVAGMDAEDVAVTDQDGQVLSAVGTGLTGGSAKQATEYEAGVQAEVAQMLEKVVGPGNATVTVAADVTNATSERMDETFTDPDGELSPSETTKTETYTGGAGPETGVLGPDNIAVPGDANGNGTYELEETTRANAVNKSTEKITTPAGEVTRQSVSVALNADAVEGVTAAQIEALVAGAAGVDEERGDAVTVEFVPFSQAGADAAAEALAQAEATAAAQAQQELIRTAIIGGAAVLAAIILAVVVAIRSRRRRGDALEVAQTSARRSSFEDDVITLTTAVDEVEQARKPEPSPTAVPDPEPGPEPEHQLVERRKREIDDMAKKDPEAAATALMSLMDEVSA